MYNNITESLTRVKQLAGSEDTTRDLYATELLTMSAAAKQGSTDTWYRVFYVAAKLLEQDLDQQALAKVDKIEFTGLIRPITSLFDLQIAYDNANDLIVPEGFSAQIALDRLCGCQSGGFGVTAMSVFTV